MRRMNPHDCLEALGVQFGLDWDDALLVTYPLAPITQEDLARIVDQSRDVLVKTLQCQRFFGLCIYVGGPLNGRRYHFDGRRRHAVRVSRGRWAVYQSGESPHRDPRLHFLGYATSQAKARRGVLLPRREGKP